MTYAISHCSYIQYLLIFYSFILVNIVVVKCWYDKDQMTQTFSLEIQWRIKACEKQELAQD